jgi:ferredoxin
MARLTVNNQPVQYRLEDDTPLLWALRDGANLTGTKYGCGTGECGACMVIVDGQAMPSCTLLLGEARAATLPRSKAFRLIVRIPCSRRWWPSRPSSAAFARRA